MVSLVPVWQAECDARRQSMALGLGKFLNALTTTAENSYLSTIYAKERAFAVPTSKGGCLTVRRGAFLLLSDASTNRSAGTHV